MNEKETVQILMVVKSIWPKTSVNDLVLNLWNDLAKGIDYAAMLAAVKAYAEMPQQTDPPHIGGLLDYARNYQYRNRAVVRRLDEPEPSAEEVAEAKRVLKEMIDKLEEKK